jgi:hypothetical protein
MIANTAFRKIGRSIFMVLPLIKCYHPNALKNENVFYILCKGDNSGCPSTDPWANSFVVICQNQKAFKFYYWLVYALFKTGEFKPRIKGSVIPYINISDVNSILKKITPLISEDWEKLQSLIDTLDNVARLKTTLLQQVQGTEQLQKCLLSRYLKAC